LQISLTRPDNGDSWEAAFDEEAIDNLTKKTGNHKTLKVFTRMLYSALEQASESVLVDVLTGREIEILRERKRREAGDNRDKAGRLDDGKMFIILTYMVEYDKVHYPLGLNRVSADSGNNRHLMGVIEGLRKELNYYKGEHATGGSQHANTSHSRIQAAPAYSTSGTGQHQSNIPGPLQPSPFSPMLSNIDNKYTFDHNEDTTSLYRQKCEKLEEKLKLLEREYQEDKERTFTIQRGEIQLFSDKLQAMEEREAALIAEVAHWKKIAEERMGGRNTRERELEREVSTLNRKINEMKNNERILRGEIREGRDKIEMERKKYGLLPRSRSNSASKPYYKPSSSQKSRGVLTPNRSNRSSSGSQSKPKKTPIQQRNPPLHYRPSPPLINRKPSPAKALERQMSNSRLSNGSNRSGGGREDSVDRRKRIMGNKGNNIGKGGDIGKRENREEMGLPNRFIGKMTSGPSHLSSDVRVIDKEIEEIDRKFMRLKELVNMGI